MSKQTKFKNLNRDRFRFVMQRRNARNIRSYRLAVIRGVEVETDVEKKSNLKKIAYAQF